MEALLAAILDAVFASLAESAGLSDWLRDRLQRDSEKLAFRLALTQALTDASAHFPGRDVRYFAEILRDIGGPLLARTLQPASPFPTAAELTQLWLNHLTIDSAIHYREDFTAFATLLFDRLNQHIENQQPLQWIVQARRQRSSEEATRRLAEASVQSAATLEALHQNVVGLSAALETAFKTNSGVRINTGGGSYIGGHVEVGGDFVGRDKVTINNYIVAGLARLPYANRYESPIQGFLEEYLGTRFQKVPFGGRAAQLAELDAWLNDPAASPYYLMTAEAGRGKSALVCRWLAQLTTRTDLDVIFVPISLRFETATQDVFFATLTTRLARLYGEDDKLDLRATADVWKATCQGYLRRSPPEGKQLLVILDGLDEATGWTPGRGLFSADPPAGLRVLVTAHTRLGETAGSSWAATLGWDNAQLARTTTLPGLQRRGVEEALVSMGNPLDTLATQVDVVGELYRLSAGDPLLVRLYVDELVKQGIGVAALRTEDLGQIAPGLQGYFEEWWKEQKKQWHMQGRDPEEEQASLRLLLDAISAALGPLTIDDLAALHPELGSSRLVRSLTQHVERWLMGDGKTQGYSYSHSRLGYFFWEQLSRQEQAVWDGRFCAWGATTLAVLNADQVESKAAPVYLLRHYANHLQRSHAPAEAFYALISNGWRKAWEELDVSNAGFLGDVEQAWERSRQAYDPTKPGKGVTLTQQIKAALCRASVAALVSNLTAELLTQAVQADLRKPVQVLAIAKLIPTDTERANMLSALAPHLPAEQRQAAFGEALTSARAIQNDDSRARVLGSLASHLPAALLGEALTAARSIQSEFIRTNVLDRLAPYLPAALLDEALTIARSIQDQHSRARMLGSLAPHLPAEQRQATLDEALTAARSIWYEEHRAGVLGHLAPYLPAALLGEALTIARSIQDQESRAWALGSLAQPLTNLYQALSGPAYRAWVETLPVLAARPRSEFLEDLAALMPFILVLAGDGAPQAAVGIFQAIQAVCAWWP